MNWMAWTPQTAAFFVAIAAGLLVMTVLEIVRPTRPARGFLPIETTRGDRFFISLLSAAFIHMAWLAAGVEPVVAASILSLVWAAAVMRWG